MKPDTHVSEPSGTRPRSSAARGRATSPDYLSAAETQALLGTSHSLAMRQARLDSADMLSTDEAGELVKASRVTVNAWINKGRAIGLTQTKRGYRMPRWQFEPRLWETLPKLSAALGTKEGWAVLGFLESPLGALQGLSPRQAIERGQAERVIELAALHSP
jgi:biotin operon repressor